MMRSALQQSIRENTTMELVQQLLRKRRWQNTCLRPNIAAPGDIEVKGKIKVARVRSNVVRQDKEPVLYKAIKEIAPEWWGEETNITVNQDVVCQRHKDGNSGHSWMLWLGDYTSGGQLHFDDGAVIDGKKCWHRFEGQNHHWNTPHEGGTKYSVILYRSNRPSKSTLIQKNCGEKRSPLHRITWIQRRRGVAGAGAGKGETFFTRSARGSCSL